MTKRLIDATMKTMEHLRVRFRNWWAGAFGRRAAFCEGGSIAFDNAAMKAWDMGRPDIRDEINEMKDRWTDRWTG